MDEIKTLLRLMLGMDGYIPSAEELLRKLPTLLPRWWIRIYFESRKPFLFSNHHLFREILSRTYGAVITMPLG